MKKSGQSITGSKNVSMAEVARRAGVSSATVSRVLSGTDPVSEKTRSQVMAVVDELGYAPDARLQGFFRRVHGNLRAVAYLCDPATYNAMTHSDGFYSRFLGAIQKVLGDAGCHMILVDALKNMASDGTPQCVADGIVDGIIAETQNMEIVNAAAKHVPTVLFNSELQLPHVNIVLPDVERAAAVQIAHLRGLGHTRIACFRIRPGSWQDGRFLRIYEQAMADDVALPDTYFAPIQFGWGLHPAAITAFLDRLFACAAPPTAILTYDIYAPEFCRQLAVRGLHVPADISLVGYDDVVRVLPGSDEVGLTTFQQDAELMAKVALELLQKRVKAPEAPAQTISVEGKLVVRESAAQCKAGI